MSSVSDDQLNLNVCQRVAETQAVNTGIGTCLFPGVANLKVIVGCTVDDKNIPLKYCKRLSSWYTASSEANSGFQHKVVQINCQGRAEDIKNNTSNDALKSLEPRECSLQIKAQHKDDDFGTVVLL